MDRNSLVSAEIDTGRKVIETLDKAGRSVDVALWADLPEYDDWRFVLASKKFNQASLRSGYLDLLKTLDQEGIPFRDRESILLQRMEDSFIKELRRKYRERSKGATEGLRIRREFFGEQFVDDAYVYRIR
jgi:hypothetical protein